VSDANCVHQVGEHMFHLQLLQSWLAQIIAKDFIIIPVKRKEICPPAPGPMKVHIPNVLSEKMA
jgi:hypothetical protein